MANDYLALALPLLLTGGPTWAASPQRSEAQHQRDLVPGAPGLGGAAQISLGGGQASAKAQGSSIARHEDALAEGDYSSALLELNRGLSRRQRPSQEEELELWLAKADFYWRYAGDPGRSLQILRQARRRMAEHGPWPIQRIEPSMAVVARLLATYRDDRTYVERFIRSFSATTKAAAVAALENRLGATRPDNPYDGALAHCLGVAHFEGQRYRAAYNAFERAVALTPAIHFTHPVRQFKRRAFSLWKGEILPITATVVMSVLLASTVLGLLATRPQRWARWGHLLPVPVLGAAWLVVHRLLAVSSARLADVSVPSGETAVVKTDLGSPLSGPLTETLLAYGAVAVLAIYLASLAINRISLPVTRYALNACAAFCIMGAWMLGFSLSFAAADVNVLTDARARYPFMFGTYQHRIVDPLPYFLSDPHAYPGLFAEGLDEEAIKVYLEEVGYGRDTERW